MNFNMPGDTSESEERDMYSSDNHSLVPYLYMHKFYEDNIGYILMDPKSKDLIAIDVGNFEVS